MKFFLTALIVLLSVSCKAQTIDTIALSDFSINNTLQFGDAPSELISLLGQPANIYNEYWEIGDVTATIYEYLGAKFEFTNSELVGFKISAPSIILNTNLTSFQVGDSLLSLNSYYPNSYNNKANGYMAINFGTGDYQYLLIKYDSGGNIVELDHRIY